LKNHLLRFLLQCITIIYLPLFTWAQFPPPAGQPGSTAIFKDSSILINWAKTCKAELGYINIADTNVNFAGSNKANYGIEADALGIADDHVISLGDAGIATLSFDPPISNGAGFDFAVFENGFNDTFLELGFVEVSSDGNRYVRFPSVSLTQDTVQIPFVGGSVDATKINNLAGKYRALYGTPFDLDDIKDSSGIDLTNITHVRIRDVAGCINDTLLVYVSFDTQGHRINDPWPIPYNTAGFDLDAVGVIHENSSAIFEGQKNIVDIYPNPFQNQLRVTIPEGCKVVFHLVNILGGIVTNERLDSSTLIEMTSLNPGIYLAQFTFQDGRMETHKIIKQ
jgi:hypothetical protein